MRVFVCVHVCVCFRIRVLRIIRIRIRIRSRIRIRIRIRMRILCIPIEPFCIVTVRSATISIYPSLYVVCVRLRARVLARARDCDRVRPTVPIMLPCPVPFLQWLLKWTWQDVPGIVVM